MYNVQTWVNAIAAVNGGSEDNYVIDITGSFSLPAAGNSLNPHITRSGIKVSLRGRNSARISLAHDVQGNLLSVQSNVTVIVRNFALLGNTINRAAVVTLYGGSLFLRDGAAVGENSDIAIPMPYDAYGFCHGIEVLGSTGGQLTMSGNAQVYDCWGNGIRIKAPGSVATISGTARIHGNGSAGFQITSPASDSKLIINGNAQIDNNGYGTQQFGQGITTASGSINAEVHLSGNAQVFNNARYGVKIESPGGRFYMDGNAQIYGRRIHFRLPERAGNPKPRPVYHDGERPNL